MFRFTIFTAILLSLAWSISAQNKRFTVSGNIVDKATGEDLIGATVYVEELKTGTAANAYGFYSVSLPEGRYRLVFSFVGYVNYIQNLDLKKDEKVNVRLEPSANELEEVVVSAESRNANVSRTEMSVERLSMKTLKRIPALMGEEDVIKAIQLLPGVQFRPTI